MDVNFADPIGTEAGEYASETTDGSYDDYSLIHFRDISQDLFLMILCGLQT